jgi:hypothetical protein
MILYFKKGTKQLSRLILKEFEQKETKERKGFVSAAEGGKNQHSSFPSFPYVQKY